jgi:hypothetical protein
MVFLLPMFVCLFSFIWFIDVPFDHYDIWFERIAYGGFQKEQLPQLFRDLGVPVGMGEYIRFRTTVVGRLFGMMGPIFLGFRVFGQNPAVWRFFLFVLVFGKLWMADRIMKLMRLSSWQRVFIGLVLVTLFSRYYIKTISVIYGVGNLLLLIAFYIEMRNSLLKRPDWIRSATAAFFLFLSLLIRELFVASIPAFLLLLLTEEIGDCLRFRVRMKRLTPYILSGVLYVSMFVYFTRHKVETAYSNDIVPTFSSIMNIRSLACHFLSFVGFGYSPFLGFILLLFLAVCLVFRPKPRITFSAFEKWSIGLSLCVVLPVCFILNLVGHATGSFSHQYLFGCLLVILGFKFITGSYPDGILRTGIRTLFYGACVVILLIRYCYSLQDVEYHSVHAKVNSQLSEYCASVIRPGDSVIYSEKIGYQDCYAIAADIFIRTRIGDVNYHQEGRLDSCASPYMNSVLQPLYRECQPSRTTWFIGVGETAPGEVRWYRKRGIRGETKSFFPFLFIERYQQYPVMNELCKILFSTSAGSLAEQRIPEIAYQVYELEKNRPVTGSGTGTTERYE